MVVTTPVKIDLNVVAVESLATLSPATLEWLQGNPGELRKVIGSLAQFPRPAVGRFLMTVTLGNGPKEGSGFATAVETAGMKVGDYARSMLLNKKDFVVTRKKQELDLYIVMPREMGFTINTRLDQVTACATGDYGFQICPKDTGPAARPLYKEQPLNEWLAVVSEPITDSDGNLKLFSLGHGSGGLWLNSNYGYPDAGYHPDGKLVFVRPRK